MPTRRASTNPPTSGRRHRQHLTLRLAALAVALLTIGAGLSIASAPSAQAYTYNALLQAGWAMPIGAPDVAVNDTGWVTALSNGGGGSPIADQPWNAPSGELFNKFAYTAANFYASAADIPYTGAFSGGIWAYSPSVSGSIVFPWTNDCSVYLGSDGNMWWTAYGNGGKAENGGGGVGACDQTGNEGWNLTNIQQAYNGGGSTAGAEWSSLHLHSACDAAVCKDEYGDMTGEDEVQNMSAGVDDPQATPSNSLNYVTYPDGSYLPDPATHWYTTVDHSKSLRLNFNAVDASGVCYLEADLDAVDGGSSTSSGDLVTSPTTGNGGVANPGGEIGQEFANDHPCDGSENYSYTLPANVASGVYHDRIMASNASQYEGAGFNSTNASTSGASNITGSTQTLEIDNTVPVVTVGDPQGTDQSVTATVQVGPSGLAGRAPVCTAGGKPAAVTQPALNTTTNGTTTTTTWTVDDPDQVGVSCTATNNDINVVMSSTGVNYTDPTNMQGAWDQDSQTAMVTATTFENASESVNDCFLDSAQLAAPNTQAAKLDAASFDPSTGALADAANAQGLANCRSSDTSSASYGLWVDQQTPTLQFTGKAADAAKAGFWIPVDPTIDMQGQETTALSGVTTESCSVDGTQVPAADISYGADNEAEFTLDAGSGVHRVACQPISGSGKPGDTYQETVKLDVPGSGGLDPHGASPDIDNGGAVYAPAPDAGWQRSAQTVTIQADHNSGAPITSITCSGGVFTGGASTATITGPADSDNGIAAELTVDGANRGLSCQATDSAGEQFALGTWGEQVDISAPGGSFVAQGSWPSPDGIEVDASDPNGYFASGVAGVDVTARNLATGAVADLGEASSIGGETYELTGDPDGQLPAGNYVLSAVVTDIAGNTGTVSGPTVSFPLRETTKLTVTAGTGRHKHTAGQQPATPSAIAQANLAVASRAVPALFAHGKLTAAAQSEISIANVAAKIAKASKKKANAPAVPTIKLAYGQRLTLSGKLTAKRKAVKGAAIRIYQKVNGTGTYSLLRTVHTGRKGNWSYRIGGGASRTLYVTYPGSSALRSATAELKQSVTGRVTLSGSGAFVASHTVTLSGRVQGGHIPADGLQVQIWYTVAGSRSPFVHWMDATSKRDGRWHYSFRLGGYTAGLTYEFEARVRGQSGWPYRGTVSKPAAKTIG
jgi:hypothetical protein